MNKMFLGPVVTLGALVFLLALHFAGLFTLPFLPTLQQLIGGQPSTAEPPQWWYKCADGTWVGDLSACPGGAQQEQLLNKPLEEYALTLEDVGAGFEEYPDSKKYLTLADFNIESEFYSSLVTNGFQQGYSSGFYRGTDPLDSASSEISHLLYKLSTIEGAISLFAAIKSNNEKTAQEEEGIDVLSLPFKGDEIIAAQFELPSGAKIYSISFRTKNIYHGILIVDTMNIFSDQTLSDYVDKVVEKTKYPLLES